jgi:hypothetical protein
LKQAEPEPGPLAVPKAVPESQPGRVRDAAVLLPLVVLFLLMPPMVTLFVVDVELAGVPLVVAYVFGVWLAAIIGAALLSHRLAPPAPVPPAGRPGSEAARPPGDDADFG